MKKPHPTPTPPTGAKTAPTTPAAEPPAAPAAESPAAPPPTPAATPAAEPAATPAEKSTDITAGQGGVMTDEVGVITGDLTLRTELSGEQVTVRAQYKDADEWYAVTGATATLKDPADLDAVHAIAVGILNRPDG